MQYDCLIVGGGIAGLQAAIQLGRYQHAVAIVDAQAGRSLLCRNYHNLLGWPNGISGPQLRALGERQARSLGVEFIEDDIVNAVQHTQYVTLYGGSGAVYDGKRLLLATGIVDNIPDLPELKPCLGTSVFVCPDCDGYEVRNQKTIVMGAGKVGAEMVMTLGHWTDQIVYVDHAPSALDADQQVNLAKQNTTYIHSTVSHVRSTGEQFHGVVLHNGQTIEAKRGFVAFGGNRVKSELAVQLGVRVESNRHIEVNPRTKETNQPHIWAAGDVVAHSEQVSIAMGDGSQAAIWIHKSLLMS